MAQDLPHLLVRIVCLSRPSTCPTVSYHVLYRYQTVEHTKFGALRVLNEDRVDAHTGFGTHGHREFEIFSYVVSGELEQYVCDFYSARLV